MPLGEDAETTRMLISAGFDLQLEHGWKYMEVRGGAEYPAMEPSLRFKIHTKPLEADSDKVYQSFDKRQVRQHIAKSIRDGVTVERSQDTSAMTEFIRLNALTRRRLGVPPQPDAWFLNIMDALISKGLGFVSIASLDGICIAASVFLCFKGSMYYKYSASDETFLGHRPNNLIAWDAMRWGCENGYSLFDFGRTDLNCEGLLRYKRGWGTVESDLVYYRICEEKASLLATMDNLRQVKPILRTTPVPVLKMIGRILYEHVG
jgi:lipid II:glycine glycyltransferase (peptidoglycan interpeptide bridge formation enzyme)